MHSLALRRGTAYACDAIGYLGVAASLAPLGLLAYRAGWGANRGYAFAVSAIPPVAATLLAAAQEAGPHRATWGKRRFGLVVADGAGARTGFGPALVRNTLKIAIPWQLGHTVGIGAAFDGFTKRDPLTLAATAITYPLIGAMIASVLLGSGRTLHDRASGSRVLATD